MTYWTEDKIREQLDGTFTRLTNEGRVEVLDVGHDFRPGHGNVGLQTGVSGKGAWAPAEDEVLYMMRCRGRPFSEISWLLSRTEVSVEKRFRILRAKGQVVA